MLDKNGDVVYFEYKVKSKGKDKNQKLALEMLEYMNNDATDLLLYSDDDIASEGISKKANDFIKKHQEIIKLNVDYYAVRISK